MANSMGSSVWVMDTASSSVPQYTRSVKLRGFRWVPNAASDTLLIKDAGGSTVASYTSIAPGEPGAVEHSYERGKWIDGFWLHTMNSGGVLYVDIM